MNKKRIFFFCFLVAVSIGILKGYQTLQQRNPYQQTLGVSSEKSIPRVSFTLNDGEHVTVYEDVPALTPFAALIFVSQKNNIQIQTKQYDFGVFVERIGDKANTNDRAWIFLVNGVPGDKASDKQSLQDGDKVTWQYTKPIF